MNRLKSYTFDNPIMTRISITKVLQHIDDYDLICCLSNMLCLLNHPHTSKRYNMIMKNQLSYQDDTIKHYNKLTKKSRKNTNSNLNLYGIITLLRKKMIENYVEG